MRSIWAAWLTFGAAGATVAYFLDPSAGRRRRARARMALDHASHVTERGLTAASRDLEHRLRGAIATATTAARPHATGDDVIVARVRSRLGHACAQAHAIVASAHDGIVELSGKVLAEDAARVVRAARSTIGVRQVVDRLERTPGRSPIARRERDGHWRPGTRLAIGAAGTGAILAGVARGGPVGLGAAVLGSIGLVRGIANVPLAELAGVSGRRPAIDVVKSITVNAPVQEVMALFTTPETFPRFMRHVKHVRRIGENRWVWSVAGPAGVQFEWEGALERVVPNELVAWKSAEGASVPNEGSVVFETIAPGVTRLTIRLRYWPPGGLVGHEIARLFGDDPARELDSDMLRLESLLERGKTTGPNGPVTRDDVAPTSWS